MSSADLLHSPEFKASLQRRERWAIKMVAEEYSGLIREHLQRTRHRHGLPESDWADVVQDTLVTLLTKVIQFDERPVLPFLRQIALNKARDMRKAKARRWQREKRYGEQVLLRAVGAESASDVTFDMLDAKISVMSARDQTALRTYISVGPDSHVAELAKVEGISEQAAQMRFSRAKARLRKQFAENQEEDEA